MSDFAINGLILKTKNNATALQQKLNHAWLDKVLPADTPFFASTIDNFVRTATGYANIDHPNGTGTIIKDDTFYGLSYSKSGDIEGALEVLKVIMPYLDTKDGDILFFTMYGDSPLFDIIYVKDGKPTFVDESGYSLAMTNNFARMIECIDAHLDNPSTIPADIAICPRDRFNFTTDLLGFPKNIAQVPKGNLFRASTAGVVFEHLQETPSFISDLQEILTKKFDHGHTGEHGLGLDKVRVHVNWVDCTTQTSPNFNGTSVRQVRTSDTYNLMVEYVCDDHWEKVLMQMTIGYGKVLGAKPSLTFSKPTTISWSDKTPEIMDRAGRLLIGDYRTIHKPDLVEQCVREALQRIEDLPTNYDLIYCDLIKPSTIQSI